MCSRSWDGRRLLSLIVGDIGFKVLDFLAVRTADAFEERELRLGLRQVVHHQIQFAEILVRAFVLWIQRKRLLVVAECLFLPSKFAGGKAEIVPCVRVSRIVGYDFLQERDRFRVLLALDHVLRFLEVGFALLFLLRRGRRARHFDARGRAAWRCNGLKRRQGYECRGG
jgi:hypothetical protein